MSEHVIHKTVLEGIRPVSPVRPFMKVHLSTLKAGDLFYVRNERGHGYRPRQFVSLGVDPKEYVYQSYLNNDIFADVYEDPHVDTAQVYVAKPFAKKIMRRARELSEDIAEKFKDIPNSEIVMSDQLELIRLAPRLPYDEYEVMKQTVRRLGLIDSNLVAKSGEGWLIDSEAFQYIIEQLTQVTDAPAPAQVITTVTPEPEQALLAETCGGKKSWWQRMVSTVAG